MGPLVHLTVRERDGVCVVQLTGEIDLSNADGLLERLTSAVSNSVRGLVVDLVDVAYLDSQGIHLLFDLQRRLLVRNQRLGLVVSDRSPLARIIQLSKLDDAVPMRSTVDQAIETVQTPQ